MRFKQFTVSLLALWVWAAGAPLNAQALVTQAFVTEVLEPVGGRVARPRDWRIKQAHRPGACVWTLAPPSSPPGSTDATRMRIETVLGVRQQGGLDAQERIQTLLEAKGRAAQVLRRCEPRDLGLFTQICLEVLEGPDRVLYAAYWETAGRNFSALLEARTTQDLWPTHATPFARMMNFEVLDMKRFEE